MLESEQTEDEKSIVRMGADCPMRGRRAVDLAQGRWRDVFHCLRNNTLADLRADSAIFMTKDQGDVIIEDFLKGTAELESVLEQKFMFWQSLPWLLCGIGAHANRRHGLAQHSVWTYIVHRPWRKGTTG